MTQPGKVFGIIHKTTGNHGWVMSYERVQLRAEGATEDTISAFEFHVLWEDDQAKGLDIVLSTDCAEWTEFLDDAEDEETESAQPLRQ